MNLHNDSDRRYSGLKKPGYAMLRTYFTKVMDLRLQSQKKLQLHEEILVQTCPGLWCVILTNWHAHNASLAGTIFFLL